jgi:uncharacterized protein YxjI
MHKVLEGVFKLNMKAKSLFIIIRKYFEVIGLYSVKLYDINAANQVVTICICFSIVRKFCSIRV